MSERSTFRSSGAAFRRIAPPTRLRVAPLLLVSPWADLVSKVGCAIRARSSSMTPKRHVGSSRCSHSSSTNGVCSCAPYSNRVESCTCSRLWGLGFLDIPCGLPVSRLSHVKRAARWMSRCPAGLSWCENQNQAFTWIRFRADDRRSRAAAMVIRLDGSITSRDTDARSPRERFPVVADFVETRRASA
jgi:hypothetical protein